MKEIVHEFGVGLEWAEDMAKAMGGYIEDNCFIVPSEFYIGNRCIVPISPDISVMLADVLYKQDVLFKLRNAKNDFIGIYFNLTEGDSSHILNEESLPIGRLNYNLAIVDSQVSLDYMVKAGAKTYNLCIFVKKKVAKQYLFDEGILRDVIDTIFDNELNAIIHYNIMNNNCIQLINELRKKEPGSFSFDLSLSATVYGLLGHYLNQILKKDIFIGKRNNVDCINIIESQEFLVNRIREPFPGIKKLADKAGMSETKYKTMYKKITGLSPYRFFMNNKIELAHDLLVSGQYGIGELADILSFSNASNLGIQFKKHFGVLPNEYIKSI